MGTILSIYFNEAIMVQENGEYKPHSFSRSGLYKPASVGPLQEHTDYFSSLPQIDEPEIFGMHVIDDAEERMPALLDEDDKGPTTFVIQDNGLLTSLDTVLMQEMVKFNRLMTNMSSSLSLLRRAIGGLAIMSSD